MPPFFTNSYILSKSSQQAALYPAKHKSEYSEKSLEKLHELGYKTLFWSYAYVDWKTDAQPTAEEGYEKLTKSAHGGEILLLHSVSSTNAQILGDVIDSFRNQGYKV